MNGSISTIRPSKVDQFKCANFSKSLKVEKIHAGISPQPAFIFLPPTLLQKKVVSSMIANLGTPIKFEITATKPRQCLGDYVEFEHINVVGAKRDLASFI